MAKSHGIAANQKKEVLIKELQSISESPANTIVETEAEMQKASEVIVSTADDEGEAVEQER